MKMIELLPLKVYPFTFISSILMVVARNSEEQDWIIHVHV